MLEVVSRMNMTCHMFRIQRFVVVVVVDNAEDECSIAVADDGIAVVDVDDRNSAAAAAADSMVVVDIVGADDGIVVVARNTFVVVVVVVDTVDADVSDNLHCLPFVVVESFVENCYLMMMTMT